MIKVNKLSYSVPGKDLYNKISFTLEDGQHCAFIGTSGTGKSTLVDIIMHPEDHLFDGKIEIDENCRIGYVSQFSQVDKAKEISVFDYIAEEFVRLQNKITDICNEMGTASDLDALMEQYQEALDAFNAIDGDNFESNILKKLSVADLDKHKDLMISKLSGGEFKLVQVIKEMLTAPTLMIMDESDVFLDFDNLNSLMNLINSHKGTLLVITHNRYLLNHCFDKILHLENTEIQEFDGRYIDYNFNLLQTKMELQELAAADDAEIERNRQLVEKLREEATIYTCASRGRALHARVSLLERLEARRIKAPFVEIKEPKINLRTENEIEETTALKVENYTVSFDQLLLENVNFEIKSNEKVALIGANGTGKTTLLREIYANNNDAITINPDIHPAFLSQLQTDMLDESNTILNEFLDAGFETTSEVEAYIANYGFDDEMINQKISNLSGGEKNILQLAKVSASNANMLLLDEPTSHLDTYSQIALEKAIANYNGAVLMVSHDFYTIVNCVDYVLLVENKTIRKMSIRKFRQMIYAKHFDKDYLQIEQKKKEVETKITQALKSTDFELAKSLSGQLEELNKKL
ncbi:ABC transporter, ATP-binding protein [Lachnospiraceae bacterium KM106-2]|nr:ABC transporter, ATP-binding protein [Lachnospiraceae bacterium KM106-2]